LMSVLMSLFIFRRKIEIIEAWYWIYRLKLKHKNYILAYCLYELEQTSLLLVRSESKEPISEFGVDLLYLIYTTMYSQDIYKGMH
ncbi:hypothetical protein ACJX0J_042507, partial [Zea mays]